MRSASAHPTPSRTPSSRLLGTGVVLLFATTAWSEPLTADEQAWVRAHPVVRVVHASNGPFAYREHDQSPVGLSLDTLALWSKRTGIQFESTIVPSLNEAFDGLRSGRFDAVMGVGRTEERQAFLRFAAPFTYSPDAIVSPSDTPFAFDVKAIGKQRVGLARSSTDLARSLAVSAPDAQLVFFDSMPEAVLATARGDVFISVVDASVAAFTVKQNSLRNVKVAGIFGAPGEVEVGVRPDWPELASVLDKACAAMTAAERDALTTKWMPLDYASDRRWQSAFNRIVRLLIAAVLVVVALGAMLTKLRRELRRRRQAELELEQALAAVARVSQEKTDLLRTVAHDLRNPLTTLSINTQMLEHDSGPPDVATIIDMRNAIDVMGTLISLLVDQQAVESGQRAWSITSLDTPQELATVLSGLSEWARQKRIELVADSAPQLPHLHTDRVAFRQVVDNLVSNAIKYSPQDSTVRIELREVTDSLQLTVRDQGPGVPPELRERVFEKYATGTATPTNGERSIGLGLWIVSRLVLNLGGRVWCDESPGGGSAFTVQWPLRREAAARAATEGSTGAELPPGALAALPSK